MLLSLLAVFASSLIFAQDYSKRGWYDKPYTRYDSTEATNNGGRVFTSANFLYDNTATEAFNCHYIQLSAGNSMSWRINQPGNGLVVRFTLPDNNGAGTKATLGVYVNGGLRERIPLDSYWAYSYMKWQVDPPTNYPTGDRYPLMRFDETHKLLAQGVNTGDTLSLQWIDGQPIGIDFIELEQVGPPLGCPSGAINIADRGVPVNTPGDFMGQYYGSAGQHIYFGPGKWYISAQWVMGTAGTKIQGAGMWYTEIYFSGNSSGGGGFNMCAPNQSVKDVYINTVNSARREGDGYRNYKSISGAFSGNAQCERVWSEHFECGMWLGAYGGAAPNGLVIRNCRMRNNYADGINLAEGCSNCVIEFSDSRNNGDDGLASWSSGPCNFNNTIRWCDIELGWRAGAVGFFGGGGHKVHNCYLGQHFGSAGVRFTADFPGCPFQNGQPHRAYNCTIYKCGTRRDLWNDILAPIEVHGENYDIPGMEATDLDIIDSQMDAIRLCGNKVRDVKLTNIRIQGTGKDGLTSTDETGRSRRGCGVYARTSQSGSATLRNIQYSDCPDGNVINVDNRFTLNIS